MCCKKDTILIFFLKKKLLEIVQGSGSQIFVG